LTNKQKALREIPEQNLWRKYWEEVFSAGRKKHQDGGVEA
jgi:hypothetical protein